VVLIVLAGVVIVALNGSRPSSPAAEGSPTGSDQPSTTSSAPAPTHSPTRTPTPTPHPTTRAPVAVAADGVPAGWPNATNTGVPRGTTLTRITGDLTIDTAGTVVSGKDIRGCIFVEANNVTIKNSKITCADAYGIRGFNNGTDFTGLKIQDSELDGEDQGFTGIAYSNFTALRLNIHGFENGFALGAHDTIQDTYVHDLKTGDSLHPDDIQTNDDGTDYTIVHNSLLAPVTNSAISLCCSDGTMNSNVLIDNNYLAGGGWTLYCPRMATTGVRVTNNLFGPANFGPTSACGPPGVATFSGNTFAGDGKPVPTG
jgi:hypothetical protein